MAQATAAKPTVLQGVYTRQQATRGAAEYQKSCAACHLDDMTGQQTSPALAGDAFLLNYEGQSLADLFERMRTTMPQNAVGSLSAQAYADVLAFILQSNRFPAGSRELDTDVELLKKIAIVRASRK